MRRVTRALYFIVPGVAALGLPLLVGAVRAQQGGGASQPPAGAGGQGGQGGQANGRAGMAGVGQMIAAGLQATPGCLGTELAQTRSGKSVIFAWFEDKKAAMAWYESPTHQQLMQRFFPGHTADGAPMQGIPDDAGPIMAIASLMMSQQGGVDGAAVPISQIAIELYEPLHAGITVNGSFSPEGMKVEGRRDIRRPAQGEQGGGADGGAGH